MSTLKYFTHEEVRRHNTEEDCWIILHDLVYDVSKFIHEHPGGYEAILEYGGSDATTVFKEVGHSDSALKLKRKYLIGAIENNDLQRLELTSTERFKVLSSWSKIKAVLSAAGFGALQELKSLIGAPKPILVEDVDSVVSQNQLPQVEWEKVDFESLDKPHPLSAIFYRHLFESNPTMVSLFWRFNLYQSLEKIFSVLGTMNAETLHSEFKSLGMRHRGRGIANIDYDVIGISVRFALGKVLRADELEAWMRAWNLFTNALKINSEQVRTFTDEELAALPAYSAQQLAEHISPNDAWLVIDDYVYDVTSFVNEHPGGKRIMEGCGRDASSLFSSMHSKYARQKLPSMLIGRYVP